MKFRRTKANILASLLLLSFFHTAKVSTTPTKQTVVLISLATHFSVFSISLAIRILAKRILAKRIGKNEKNETDDSPLEDFVGKIPEKIKEAIQLIEKTEECERMGVNISKTILLTGPSGTGKTLLAKTFAKKTNSHFISAAKEINNPFDLAIHAAKSKNQNVVLFIDKVDSIGPNLSSTNTLLTEFDKVTENNLQTLNANATQKDAKKGHIFVIAATNSPDSLDGALRQRFDYEIEVPLPDKENRKKILQYYAGKYDPAPKLDFSDLASKTNEFSPSDLRQLIERSAHLAILDDKIKEPLPAAILQHYVGNYNPGPRLDFSAPANQTTTDSDSASSLKQLIERSVHYIQGLDFSAPANQTTTDSDSASGLKQLIERSIHYIQETHVEQALQEKLSERSNKLSESAKRMYL